MTEEQILASPMNDMINMSSVNTGLPVVIWIGEITGHDGPSLKASNTRGKFNFYDNFVITVDQDPQVITPRSVKLKSDEVEDIKNWIKLNYETLMLLWKHFETNEGDFIELLSKLNKL